MASTNFAALTDEQYTVWSRDFWREARNKTFLSTFMGDSSDAMVQRIVELSNTTDGARAVITMVNDAVGDGVVGDNTLKGNEEALRSTDNVIRIDQWRQAHKTQGRMADQKSIVKFRKEAKDKLTYTAARVMNELGFLTLSGVSYAFKTDGTARVGSQLPQLEYAADVTAPSSRRYLVWDVTGFGVNTANTDLVAADTPTWAMLVDLKAYAVNEFIRPMRSDDGVEVYNVFMTPNGVARLKKDANFLAAWQHAQKRGETNPLFKGTKHGGTQGIYIDGLNILEYRDVYHSATWGGGTVSGQRVLLCGAQSLAFADIKGMTPTWVEDDTEDYGNTLGIATGKAYGFKKPVLYNTHTSNAQDFGVICVDTAA